MADGMFTAYTGRIDESDPAARESAWSVNGISIPMLATASTADDALFAKAGFGYAAGESYTVSVTLGDRSAGCAFVAPVITWVEITAPQGEAFFAPGEPLGVTWRYEEGTPAGVYLEVWPEDGESDFPLYRVELEGTQTAHTIPGSATVPWGAEGGILITVDLGEQAWPIQGALATPGSFVATVLPGDAVIVRPGEDGPQDEWIVTVTLVDGALDADGASTTTAVVWVENLLGQPCPYGTAVGFSADPPGRVMLDPLEAITTNGQASSTITAGTVPGAVTIRAEALGAVGTDELRLEQDLLLTVTPGMFPTFSWAPNDPMFGLIVFDGTPAGGILEWGVVANGLAGFHGPVTYAALPSGGRQVYPPLMGQPGQLVTGQSYTVGLVDAEGDTTFAGFTQ